MKHCGTAICTKEWKDSDAKEWFRISERQATDSTVWSVLDVDGNEHPAHMGLMFLWGLIHLASHIGTCAKDILCVSFCVYCFLCSVTALLKLRDHTGTLAPMGTHVLAARPM